jgi:hypothetical protein
MKLRLALLTIALMTTMSAYAEEYSCKVYCESSSGPTTTVTVQASSAAEAASIVDKQGHEICQGAGYNKASSSTMSASQCSKN